MRPREIESSLPADVRPVNLIGRTDLRLLAGVLARCGAFVSNDSGAMHLAAAIGVPVAAIFGPTDDRVTRPLGDHDVLVHQVFCRPCMLRDCPIDHRCMKGITADAVVAAVTARLEPRAVVRRIAMTMKTRCSSIGTARSSRRTGISTGSTGWCSFRTASMPSAC